MKTKTAVWLFCLGCCSAGQYTDLLCCTARYKTVLALRWQGYIQSVLFRKEPSPHQAARPAVSSNPQAAPFPCPGSSCFSALLSNSVACSVAPESRLCWKCFCFRIQNHRAPVISLDFKAVQATWSFSDGSPVILWLMGLFQDHRHWEPLLVSVRCVSSVCLPFELQLLILLQTTVTLVVLDCTSSLIRWWHAEVSISERWVMDFVLINNWVHWGCRCRKAKIKKKTSDSRGQYLDIQQFPLSKKIYRAHIKSHHIRGVNSAILSINWYPKIQFQYLIPIFKIKPYTPSS